MQAAPDRGDYCEFEDTDNTPNDQPTATPDKPDAAANYHAPYISRMSPLVIGIVPWSIVDVMVITKNTNLRVQSRCRSDSYEHLIYSTGFRNLSQPSRRRRRLERGHQRQETNVAASKPFGRD